MHSSHNGRVLYTYGLNFWTSFRIVCSCSSQAPGHGLSSETGSCQTREMFSFLDYGSPVLWMSHEQPEIRLLNPGRAFKTHFRPTDSGEEPRKKAPRNLSERSSAGLQG